MATERARARCAQRLISLAAAGLDVTTLRYEAVAELRRAVGFERWAWPLADPEALIPLAGIAEHDYGPAVPRLLELEYSARDFAGMTTLARRPSPAASLHRETGGELRRSARWDEVLMTVGIGDEAAVACRDRFGCWGWLKAYRESADPPFTPVDIELLAQSSSILGTALRRSLARERPPRDGAPRRPGVVLLDRALRPIAQTAAAGAWIETLPAAHMYAALRMLPAMVYPVATLARARGDAGPHRALERASDGRWVVIEADALERDGKETIAVTIREGTPAETFGRLSRLHALTQRERQVVANVLSGADTTAVSARLSISRHTVQDHLKSVFAKVGVRSRRELVAELARPLDLARDDAPEPSDRRSPSG